MSVKDSEKKFVGKPIFKQVIDFLPKSKFDLSVKKHNADRYYKAFPAYTQLVMMLFDVFYRCNSMDEICDGLVGMQGKLNHIGLSFSPTDYLYWTVIFFYPIVYITFRCWVKYNFSSYPCVDSGTFSLLNRLCKDRCTNLYFFLNL